MFGLKCEKIRIVHMPFPCVVIVSIARNSKFNPDHITTNILKKVTLSRETLSARLIICVYEARSSFSVQFHVSLDEFTMLCLLHQVCGSLYLLTEKGKFKVRRPMGPPTQVLHDDTIPVLVRLVQNFQINPRCHLFHEMIPRFLLLFEDNRKMIRESLPVQLGSGTPSRCSVPNRMKKKSRYSSTAIS
jgi:hypothetical protein